MLGVGGATVVGLGAMIGTGVFAAWTPAVQLAGSALLLALALAAVVAACFAGLLMHNFGGLTPSYDIAFAAAVAVVWLAVLPLAAHIDRTRVP